MSKEKLYALKNDDCEWADSKHIFGHGAWATPDKTKFEQDAKHYGGHVVTLIEEPEKVVLNKAQTEIVEEARGFYLPATLISQKSGNEEEEELLMKAYVNGYTVGNEKKYHVKFSYAIDAWYYKDSQGRLQIFAPASKKLRGDFTESEIEHYGLQDCERVELD